IPPRYRRAPDHAVAPGYRVPPAAPRHRRRADTPPLVGGGLPADPPEREIPTADTAPLAAAIALFLLGRERFPEWPDGPVRQGSPPDLRAGSPGPGGPDRVPRLADPSAAARRFPGVAPRAT